MMRQGRTDGGEMLRRFRPDIVVGCVIVGAFVLGMLLTPPDVISQTMMAIPMWLLFEVGVFFSRMFVPVKTEDAETVVDQPGDPGAS